MPEWELDPLAYPPALPIRPAAAGAYGPFSAL